MMRYLGLVAVVYCLFYSIPHQFKIDHLFRMRRENLEHAVITILMMFAKDFYFILCPFSDNLYLQSIFRVEE